MYHSKDQILSASQRRMKSLVGWESGKYHSRSTKTALKCKQDSQRVEEISKNRKMTKNREPCRPGLGLLTSDNGNHQRPFRWLSLRAVCKRIGLERSKSESPDRIEKTMANSIGWWKGIVGINGRFRRYYPTCFILYWSVCMSKNIPRKYYFSLHYFLLFNYKVNGCI